MNDDTEHRCNITQQSIDQSEVERLRDELGTKSNILIVRKMRELNKLRARATAAEDRVKELEKAFRHTHKAKAFKSDACATCPFDLRDPIHRRFGDG